MNLDNLYNDMLNRLNENGAMFKQRQINNESFVRILLGIEKENNEEFPALIDSNDSFINESKEKSDNKVESKVEAGQKKKILIGKKSVKTSSATLKIDDIEQKFNNLENEKKQKNQMDLNISDEDTFLQNSQMSNINNSASSNYFLIFPQ